jgi:plastocyanin
VAIKVFALAVGVVFLVTAANAATFTVQVGPNNGFSFVPATQPTAPGDTLHWVWSSTTISHSTTSGTCSGSTCTPDGQWNSGIHNAPFSFDVTLAVPGTYPYFCSVHGAAMQGMIVVSPTAIPTLTTWGFILLGILFTLTALRIIRKYPRLPV